MIVRSIQQEAFQDYGDNCDQFHAAEVSIHIVPCDINNTEDQVISDQRQYLASQRRFTFHFSFKQEEA